MQDNLLSRKILWYLYHTVNSCKNHLKIVLTETNCNPCWQSKPMRGGFSRYIGSRPEGPRRDPWISEGPLSHRHFILIDFSIFWGYFQLFFVYGRPSFHYITYIYCLTCPNFASSCLKIPIEFISGLIGPQFWETT